MGAKAANPRCFIPTLGEILTRADDEADSSILGHSEVFGELMSRTDDGSGSIREVPMWHAVSIAEHLEEIVSKVGVGAVPKDLWDMRRSAFAMHKFRAEIAHAALHA